TEALHLVLRAGDHLADTDVAPEQVRSSLRQGHADERAPAVAQDPHFPYAELALKPRDQFHEIFDVPLEAQVRFVGHARRGLAACALVVVDDREVVLDTSLPDPR